jgi:hypothetical protein
MKATLRLLTVLAAVTTSAGCVAWLTPYAPLEAGSAQIGATYRYTLFTHCGLDLVPIEFDGSEWRIEGDPGGANPPSGFGNPEDEGTVTLSSDDEGTYTSSEGVERTIVREGLIQPKPSDYLIPCL